MGGGDAARVLLHRAWYSSSLILFSCSMHACPASGICHFAYVRQTLDRRGLVHCQLPLWLTHASATIRGPDDIVKDIWL